ncbi:MAG TPA: cupredoxin domain-containing protein [Aeromicrobium sp.]|nr:cupredoxin domain-containing protein [Aeromicrobium sp.]
MPKVFAAVLLAAVLAACGSEAADTTVAVTGSDSKCDVADTSLKAGKIRFNLTNEGKLTTELYVLGEKDRIIGEVENVTPGVTRPLEANLKAGKYTLVCKPGQTGEGIRQPITVTGEGGETSAESAEAERKIEVEARDYAFTFESPLEIARGDAVEFELKNLGTEQHEFEVLNPTGAAIGEIEAIDAGKEAEATFEFTETGTYSYQCLVETADGVEHSEKGMKGTFTVS